MAIPPLTLLEISPISGQSSVYLTPYSVRGITQTISPIPSAGLERSVNGTLLDFTYPQFRKYQTEISCRDVDTPALDSAWVGELAEVQCAIEFSYRTGGVAQRPAVSGSVRVAGDFTFYRPILMMRIATVSNAFREWAAEYAWQIRALEI